MIERPFFLADMVDASNIIEEMYGRTSDCFLYSMLVTYRVQQIHSIEKRTEVVKRLNNIHKHKCSWASKLCQKTFPNPTLPQFRSKKG